MPLDHIYEDLDLNGTTIADWGDEFLSPNQKAFEEVALEYENKKGEMMRNEYTRNQTLFEENGYVVVARDFVPDEVAEVFTQYAIFQMINEPEIHGDSQVSGSYNKYIDTFAESLLHGCTSRVELHTGKKLIPTYSYYRVYKEGDILEDHEDRPACEISASIMMGFSHNITIEKCDYNFCLHGYVNGEKKYFPHSATGAVIYKGCELTHGRDRFDVGEGSYQVQVFLHYVDKNGPYAKEWAFDKRPSIGLTKETINRVYGNGTNHRY